MHLTFCRQVNFSNQLELRFLEQVKISNSRLMPLYFTSIRTLNLCQHQRHRFKHFLGFLNQRKIHFQIITYSLLKIASITKIPIWVIRSRWVSKRLRHPFHFNLEILSSKSLQIQLRLRFSLVKRIALVTLKTIRFVLRLIYQRIINNNLLIFQHSLRCLKI